MEKRGGYGVNIFWTAGPRTNYTVSVANPPRGMKGRRRMRRRTVRIIGKGKSNGSSPPPGRILLRSGSRFVVIQDRYVVKNFHVVERTYNMTLRLE